MHGFCLYNVYRFSRIIEAFFVCDIVSLVIKNYLWQTIQ